MGITFKTADFIAKLKQFRDGIAADMEKLTDTVVGQTRSELSTNLDSAVYNTPSGYYMRTGQLKSLAYASKSTTASLFTVVAGDSADYASDIEFGSRSAKAAEDDILSRAAASSGNWVSYGRSGINWQNPGAYLTPAIYKASLKINMGFELIIKDRWSKNG